MNTDLKRMADEAAFSVSDLLDETRADEFDALSDLQKVQWRYAHADCDDFAQALHEITGWPIVALSHPKRGPVHRLCQNDQGALVDVHGTTTLTELIHRYHLRQGAVQPVQRSMCTLDPESLCGVIDEIEVLGSLGLSPFNATDFSQRCERARQNLRAGSDEDPSAASAPGAMTCAPKHPCEPSAGA